MVKSYALKKTPGNAPFPTYVTIVKMASVCLLSQYKLRIL